VIGPASLGLSLLLAIGYYQKAGNLIASLAIVFFGPIILGLASSLFLSWHKGRTKDKEAFWLSRTLGGFFAAAWGGICILLGLALLTMLPVSHLPGLKAVQSDVRSSASYQLVQAFTHEKNLTLPSFEENLKTIADPGRLEMIQSSEEFQSLQEHPKIRAILDDEHILEQIESQNFAGLLSNPKILALLEDEELIKKFLELNQKIVETGDAAAVPSGPKVYEVNSQGVIEAAY
jgi:hypothetical protein